MTNYSKQNNTTQRCQLIELASTTYIFKDVPGDGNCAFHAMCSSNMIPVLDHAQLRSAVCHFALSEEGKRIATRIFSYMASMDITNMSLEEYIHRMSEAGTYAGNFEFTIVSFLYDINITVISRLNATLKITTTHQTLASFSSLSDLVQNVTWGNPRGRNMHLLHHVYGMPDSSSINMPNHFGTLFPLTQSELHDCTRCMQSVLTALLRRNSNSTQRHTQRKNQTKQHIEKSTNTIARRLKRQNPLVRQEEQAHDTKRKRFKQAYRLQEQSQSQISRQPRLKKVSKTTVASMDTNRILNNLTEAKLTNEEQNDLLKETPLEDVYYALNSFHDLMGEDELMTVLCAVCAIKHIPKDITRLPMQKVPHFNMLRAMPEHKTLDSTGKWVLMQDAIFKQNQPVFSSKKNQPCDKITDKMFDINICKKCFHQLQNGQIPVRSLVSFDTGMLPNILKSIRLTFVERMLLSCNFTIFHIFKVENPRRNSMPSSTRARVSKGHCISFKHANTTEIIENIILPHEPTMLPKLMIIAFIGISKSLEEARELVRQTKQLTVRTEVIHLFAKEYAKINPQHIKHEPSRFENHKSGTVPNVIMNTIDFESLVEDASLGKATFLDMDDAIHDDYAKRDQVRPDEDVDPDIDVIQTSGMVLPHLMSNGMQELKERSLQKLRTHLLAIPRSKTPLSDYDPRYFLNNYPNIFFHNTGERPPNVSLQIYLDTLMRRQCTGAALDYSFPFEARNVILRHRTLQNVRFSLSLEHSSIIPKITDENLADALDAIQNNEPINDKVKSLLKQLEITGADLRGTPQRLNRYRQQILTGLFPMFGPFDVWITLNIQESSSQVLLRIAGEQDVPISYKIPPNVPNITRRMQICAENPLAVAEFFHVFMQAFLAALLGLPYGRNDYTPTHKGVFGWTKAYMFILEVSGKATGPHAHGLLKVEGLNRQKLIDRMNDANLVDLYKKYLLSTFSQNLPNDEFDVELPKQGGKENDLLRHRRLEEQLLRPTKPQLISRNKQYMGMYPLKKLPFKNEESEFNNSDDVQRYLAKRLIKIIRECMIHEHSPTCAKNGHSGDDNDCRMSYPQPIFDDIAVYLDEHIDKETQKLILNGVEVIFPRDHRFVVAMNKWVTLALGSNTAVYYMASGRQGRTKAIYATEYSTKKPLSTYECIALFKASLQAKRTQQAMLGINTSNEENSMLSSTTIVNRCLNALSGEVVITGYECCADICNYPDHYASNSFVPLSGWSYMYSMTGTSSRQNFNIVSKPKANMKERTATLVSAIQDYMYLDIADDQKMTAFQFTAFYQRVSKTKDKLGARHLEKSTCAKHLLPEIIDKSTKRCDENNESSDDDYEEDIKGSKYGEKMLVDHIDLDENNDNTNINKHIGRPMHTRIGFKPEHKLSATHHVYRVAKMRVPYQVGRRYPTLPSPIEKASKDQLEMYAKYMLGIFRPWSASFNNAPAENETWWSTLISYISSCEPWIPTIMKNMRLATERDDNITKARNNMERISTNTMNHAQNKFVDADDDEMDWKINSKDASELLQQLEADMILTGFNPSRPMHQKDQIFISNGMKRLFCRFNDQQQQALEKNYWQNNASLESVLEQQFSKGDIALKLKSWHAALKELARCNDAGTTYNMDTVTGAKVTMSNQDFQSMHNQIEGIIHDPILVPLPDPGNASMFEKTETRPSWTRLDTPPTIVETLEEWHLTRKQTEFAILVLTHFHNLIEKRNPEQLLALCLGAPGTGKSQTMLAILWHMSQHRQSSMRSEVATCAFTGGAAMLISTPHTTPMTTCRQFQINLKGPSKSIHSLHVLSNRTCSLMYVFIDEFSFLSYRHLKDIAEQVTVGLGERADKHKPFGGMNFVFFGDYEQLHKPADYPMYYGAAAEENIDSNDMKTWFSTEVEHHIKKSAYDSTATFIGRGLWTSIDTIRTLTVQKRQGDTEDGLKLLARCQALRDEHFPEEFFDSIQSKAITNEQLTSQEWSNALYIVMRHTLRIPIDFNEAKFQAHRQSKRFIQWRTLDTILGKPLPQPLQLVVDNIIIDKIPRMQYFYEGMPIAFVDNKYFAAGNATNNMGRAVSIALDPREPLDDFSKPFRELTFLPAYVLVHVSNAQMEQLYPDLPPKVIPVIPTIQSHRLRLGDNRYRLQSGKNVSHIKISRLGMRWIGVHAVTQYFSQGMNLAGRKCILDLRIPLGGVQVNDYAQSVLVMLSRHKQDSDWALLHPLWTPGNELQRLQVITKMKKLLCRDPNLHAELRRINSIELNMTEPCLQLTLANNPDLAKFVESAKYH